MPDHDLVALWEAHTPTEFETHDVDGTMATMVDQPYVNHIPTMTGGVGHDQLKRFYKYHFIGANPPDTSMAAGPSAPTAWSMKCCSRLPHVGDRLDAAGHPSDGAQGRDTPGGNRAVQR
jgi:hypothetical protein